MRLAEWLTKYEPVLKYRPVVRFGETQVFTAGLEDARDCATALWALFHLEDQAVRASVSGPAFVLGPRMMDESSGGRHTPGPWTLQPIGDETECNILGKGRELIATVSDNDARLIAAAPELYEEARKSLRNVESLLYEFPVKGDEVDRRSLEGWRDGLRAAMAKAEGQP